MTKYLLLRDNKQSGPYSVDELQTKGLKAYDLVWIDGKSAAWRYPSEIDELKSFAPIVEEQPFDRFFKKTPQKQQEPIAEKKEAAPQVKLQVQEYTAQVPEEKRMEEIPAYVPPQQLSAKTTGKKVYVTMPAGRRPAPPKEEPKKETEKQVFPVHPEYAQGNAQTNVDKYPKISSSVVTGTAVVLDDDPYQQNGTGSLYPGLSSAVSKPDGQKTGTRSKQVITNRMGQMILVGIVVIILLGAGIFIGTSLNKNPAPETASQTPQKNVPPPVNVNVQPAENSSPASQQLIPADSVSAKPKEDQTAEQIKSTAPDLQPQIKDKETRNPLASKKAVAKDPVLTEAPVVKKDSSPSLVISETGHREAIHRDDVQPAQKETGKVNIYNQVTVNTNKYNVGTFGGISDLEVSVYNHSQYPLDMVIVEVQYVQANKKTFKTENIYFKNVAAGATLMQVAPQSPRGIKVEYKITTISSKESGLSYTGM